MRLIFLFLVLCSFQHFDPPQNVEELQKQKAFFQERGYLWIKDFFSPQQTAQLQNWATAMNTAAEQVLEECKTQALPLQHFFKTNPTKLIVVAESKNPKLVCRVEDMLTCYPDLHGFIETQLTVFLAKLFDEPYVLFKDKLNFKWPGGGAFLPHQDFPAYSLLAPREHVTAMISIDPATLENGCLYVAQNWSGKSILPYVEGGSGHGSIQRDSLKNIQWLPLKTSPRDLVLISSYVPHYSENNKSPSSRRAMFFTYNRRSEGEHRKAYYNAKRNDPDNPIFHFGTPTNARGK